VIYFAERISALKLGPKWTKLSLAGPEATGELSFIRRGTLLSSFKFKIGELKRGLGLKFEIIENVEMDSPFGLRCAREKVRLSPELSRNDYAAM
jgi:hypothetical protein